MNRIIHLVALIFFLVANLSAQFVSGDRIQNLGSDVNLRDSSYISFAKVAKYDIGTVISGPVYNSGYSWFQVKWDGQTKAGYTAYDSSYIIQISPGPFTLTAATSWNSSPPTGPSVALSWTAAARASYYQVYRDGGLYYDSLSQQFFTNNTNLISGQSYNFMIIARVNGDPKSIKESNSVTLTMPYPPATPPTVATNSATNITSNSATLNGIISSNGGSAVSSYRFDWGLTTPLNQVVLTNISVSGNTFSSTLNNLTPNTTYYFRAWAQNGSSINQGDGTGWAKGSIVSFTTAQAPRPNLVLNQPNGWPTRLLISTQLGNTSSTIASATSDDNLYVSFVPANSGQTPAPYFLTSVTVDGVTKETVAISNGLAVGAEQPQTGIDIGKLTVGQHSIQVKVDSDNRIDEISENDNAFDVPITITGPTGPIVSISSPSFNSSWSVGSTVPIIWTLSGVTTGVTGFRVSIFQNGTPAFTSPILLSSARAYGWTVPSTFVSTGGSIKVEALGQIPTSASVSFLTTPVTSGRVYAVITMLQGSKVYLNKPISFSASSSSGNISSYSWKFSDGATSNEENPSHTFTSGSSGWAELTVQNGSTSSIASVAFALQGIGPPSVTSSGSGADPVNTATGNFVLSDTLMSVDARGVPFVFQAYYNSLAYRPASDTAPATEAGSLGFGWSHSFETNLTTGIEDGVRFALIAFADGHREKYTRQSNGAWSPEPGNYSTFTENPNGSFSLSSRRQLIQLFDSDGKLVKISDRFGNSLDVEWESYGVSSDNKQRIHRVLLPGGPASSTRRQVLFEYLDPNTNSLWKLTDAIGRTVVFTHDEYGDLRAIEDPRHHITRYTYDTQTTGLHQMLSITDARSHRAVLNTYNSDRRVATQIDASDTLFQFDYNFPTPPGAVRTTTITRFADASYPLNDARNQVTEDVHNDKLQLVERKVFIVDPDDISKKIPLTESYSYDPVTGDPASSTNRNGHTTQTAYTNGNLTQITTADGAVTTIEYTDPLNPYLPTLKTLPGGLIKEKWEYNTNGFTVAHTFPYDSINPLNYRRTYTPDSYGQIETATDAEGNQTSYFHDDWGNLWKTQNAEGYSKQAEFDDIGRIIASTDERGFRSSYDLDANGNVETTHLPNPLDTSAPLLIQKTYDENNNCTSVEDPLGHFSYTGFDPQDRVVRVENHLHQATITTLDKLGSPVDIEDPRHNHIKQKFNLAGYLLETRDQTDRVHTFVRDAAGNAIEETDEDGMRITRTYDEMERVKKIKVWKSDTEYDETEYGFNLLGQQEWEQNPKGERTSFCYNAAGQRIKLIDHNSKETLWDYDKEGHEISATLANGKTRYQSYNGVYQLKDRTDENGKIERFYYDPAGNPDYNLIDGQETHFEHDSLNLLTKIIPPTGPPIVYTHDAAGRVQTMDDSIGRTSWTYTSLNQVSSLVDPYGQGLEFQYDESGNRTQIIYPGNHSANYTYDAANRFESVTDWSDRKIQESYTPGGRPLQIEYPNGVVTRFGYDGTLRQNHISHRKGSETPFIEFGYEFDAKGKIIDVSQVHHPLAPDIPERNDTYTYDDANQLATINELPVTHDNRGNITSGPLTLGSTNNDSLTWDFSNHLKSGILGGVPFTNDYNGQGQRLQATNGGITKRFLVDGSSGLSKIMMESDGGNSISAFYLYAGNGLAARILTNGSISYYHCDRSGNVSALTDESGSISALYQYDSFGVSVGSSGSLAQLNSFRYLGGWGVYDNGNGILDTRARTYSPGLARFLSRDQLFGNQQDGQSLNRYTYALNDPISRIDPSGLSPKSAVLSTFYSESPNSTTLTKTISDQFDRKSKILLGLTGNIILSPNPSASGNAPFFERQDIGTTLVSLYDKQIETAASLTGVDADLIRSIIYIETSHGYYDPSIIGFPILKSILPMNINVKAWGSNFGSRNELRDPESNILMGALLIKRIQNLSPSSGISEIATLYNNLNASSVSDYGMRVNNIYTQKLWK